MRVDLALYGISAVFAGVTALTSSLAPHRAWGAIAWVGYAVATILALLPRINRLWLAVGTWVAVCLVPLVVQAVQRAGGRLDRAQEEVLVIEDGGRRLIESGTPYLGRDDIAALPDPLLGYMPYQPGMALFGLPRAAGNVWFTDARVWFAIVTAAALVVALRLLPPDPARRLRAFQVATVLPVCALTLATGGDDLPVLSLCLLALALTWCGLPVWAGVAVGAAAALKLFAWPVLLVLAVMYRFSPRFLVPAVGVPVLTTLPALLLDPAAFVENVLAFPLGRGLVTSPAASPLPGHLIATNVAGGRAIALGLLALAAVVIAVWMWRDPPRNAAEASLFCGVGLLAAMLLLPATRFGYLLYPAAFLVWTWVLRTSEERQ